MSSPKFTRPPPAVPNTRVSFPVPHVLLVTLDRPDALNAIPRPQHFALERLWNWFDEEPSLRAAVLTGSGRAFCAGADLKEWDSINGGGSSSAAAPPADDGASFPRGGFGGMSNRGGRKPIIAAVGGLCLGGGMEMAINCDMVVAADDSTFGLPEVTIGVIALAGALPRLVRTVGRQRASEMALGGRKYGAAQMREWGLVNEVVPAGFADAGRTTSHALKKALEWAARIANNSPDSVIVSREGLKLGWEGVDAEKATDMLMQGWYGRMNKGENMVEGVKSFVERRKPVWKDSKL